MSSNERLLPGKGQKGLLDVESSIQSGYVVSDSHASAEGAGGEGGDESLDLYVLDDESSEGSELPPSIYSAALISPFGKLRRGFLDSQPHFLAGPARGGERRLFACSLFSCVGRICVGDFPRTLCACR